MNKLFAHIADIHLDSPFDYLDDKKQLERKIEQREIFKKTIEDANNKGVDFLLISGDIFDGEIASFQTLSFIDGVFGNYPLMKIVLIAGNHDLYKNDLFYKYNYKSNNVVVLSSNNPFIVIDNVVIHSQFSINALDHSKYNILMWHGDVVNSGQTNPLPTNIRDLGFDYIALGHVHQYEDHSTTKTSIFYPGCLISRGFDESGKKGYLLVNYSKDYTKVTKVEINQRTYELLKIDVSNINYDEPSIVNEIQKNIKDINNLYRIELVGTRKESLKLNKDFLESSLLDKAYYIKIKDNTTVNDNTSSPIEEIFKEKINLMLNNQEDESLKEVLLIAKSLGIKALRNEVISDEDYQD